MANKSLHRTVKLLRSFHAHVINMVPTITQYNQRGKGKKHPLRFSKSGNRKIEELESALTRSGFQMLEIPKEALFLAGKAFLRYRKNRGMIRSPLPDFYIGAQAAIFDMDLITRDVTRYRTYFPTVGLISPEMI